MAGKATQGPDAVRARMLREGLAAGGTVDLDALGEFVPKEWADRAGLGLDGVLRVSYPPAEPPAGPDPARHPDPAGELLASLGPQRRGQLEDVLPALDRQQLSGKASLDAVEAAHRWSCAASGARLHAVRELAARTGADLLADKGVADPAEMSKTARERWRAEAKAVAVAELVALTGSGRGAAQEEVAIASLPDASRRPVEQALEAGIATWALVLTWSRRCARLAHEDATAISRALFATCIDPAEAAVERLTPEGVVSDAPWAKPVFHDALERLATAVEGADPEVRERELLAAHEARDAYAIVDDDGTARLVITGDVVSVTGAAARLQEMATKARNAGDPRRKGQLRSDIARALLVHGVLPLPDLGGGLGLISPDDVVGLVDVLTGVPSAHVNVIVSWEALTGAPALSVPNIYPGPDPASVPSPGTTGGGGTGPDAADVTGAADVTDAAARASDDGDDGKDGELDPRPRTCASGSPSPEGTSPPPEGMNPSHEGASPPSDGTSLSHEGTSAPSEETSAPSEGASPSHGGTSPPSEGTSALSEGTSAPSEGASPSHEGRSPSTDEGAGDGASFGLVRVLPGVGRLLGRESRFLTAAEVRAIAGRPGTTLYRILMDPADGRCIERSAAGYAPDAAMRAQIIAADVTSRAPGSTVPAPWCDLDHVQEYLLGGPTSEPNLQSLDRPWHALKTRKFWDAVMDATRNVTWESFWGRVYDTREHDYRQYLTQTVSVPDPAAPSATPPGRPPEAPPTNGREHEEVGGLTLAEQRYLASLLVYAALAHRRPGDRLVADDDEPGADVEFLGLHEAILIRHTTRDGRRKDGPRPGTPSPERLVTHDPREVLDHPDWTTIDDPPPGEDDEAEGTGGTGAASDAADPGEEPPPF